MRRCCRCEKHTRPSNDGDCNRDSSSRISSEEECTVFHQWKINKQQHIDEQDCSSGDFENSINPTCIQRHVFQNCKFSNPNSHNAALDKKEINQICHEDPGTTELFPYTTILDDQNKCIPSTSHNIFHSPINTYNSSSYSSFNSSCVYLRNNKITCLSNEENIINACKHHGLSNWSYLDSSKNCIDDDFKINNIKINKYNQNFDVYNITVAPMDNENANRISQNTRTHYTAQRREDILKNSKSNYQDVSQNESQNSIKVDKKRNKYLFHSERLKSKHQTNLEKKESDVSSSSTESGEFRNLGKRKHRPLTSKGTGSYYPEKRTLKKKLERRKYKIIKPMKKLKVIKEPSYNYLENCKKNKCHASCRMNQHIDSLNPDLNESDTLINKQNLSSSNHHQSSLCHCRHSHKCKQMNSKKCNESIDQCNRFENEESNDRNKSKYCNHMCNCNKLRNKKMDSNEMKTKKDIANGNIKMTDSGNKIIGDVNDVRTNDTETNTSNLKNNVNQNKITTIADVEEICDDNDCSFKKVSLCNRSKLSGDGKVSMQRHITDVVVLNQPKTDVHCERYNTNKISRKNIGTSPKDNDDKKNNSTGVKTLNFGSMKKNENKNLNKLGFCEATHNIKKSPFYQNQQITSPCGKIIFLVLEEPSCKAGCCFRVYRQCTTHGTTVPANRYTLQCSSSVSVPKPIYPIKNHSNDCCLSQEARDENWSECFYISYEVHQNEDLNCNNESDTGTDYNSGKNNSS